MKQTLPTAILLLTATLLTNCAGGAYYVAAGPPPPRYGVVGYAPGPGYVWSEGFYDRHGSSWAWVPGTWRRPPHRGATWVAPAWRQEGRNWRFHRGYWR